MTDLNKQLKLIETLNKNPTLCEIVRKLQTLYLDMTNQEIEEVIKEMDLPFNLHLFVMGNFSDLMRIKFESSENG